MSYNSNTYEDGEFILDSNVPDINVPIMKFSKRKPFVSKWIHQNAKAKLANSIKKKQGNCGLDIEFGTEENNNITTYQRFTSNG